MPTAIPRTFRTLLRVLGACLLVLAIASGVFVRWLGHGGATWLDGKVEARIHAVIAKASVPGYHIALGSLKADARKGSLVVTDADLDFEPRLLDSLRTGTYRYLFSAKVGRVEMRGLSFWGLLLHGEVRVQAIALEEPEFHYYTGPKRVDLADPFKRLGHTGKGLVSVLVADTLVIQGADASVQDLNKLLPELKVSGLHIGAHALSVGAKGGNAGVYLSLEGAELNVDSISSLLPDGSRLHIGVIALSRAERNGKLMDIRITPEQADTTNPLRPRKCEMSLAVDSILLSGLDLDRSIADEALIVNNINILGFRARLELDKTLPEHERTLKRLPLAALDAMPFTINVDTVRLIDADVLYRERDPRTRRWGEIPFTGMNARFHNITNEGGAIAENDSIRGDFTFKIFSSGEVKGDYSAVLDGSDRFRLTASLAQLPLVELNRASRPLLHMEVERGILHTISLRMEANARRAKGSLAMDYSDLLVRVEPGTPSGIRHSMMGNVMDIMLSQEYGGGMSADRDRNFTIEHNPERSIFNYVWRATREGLVRNLVPEAKQRMRKVLKQDAELRREERAVRKEKKEEAH